MSDQYEIILDPYILSMLAEIEEVFRRLDIDFYFAGAFARDLQFKSRQPDSNFRKTGDIDFAVCVGSEEKYNEVIEALVATGAFKRDAAEIIKLHHRSGIEVDLIPFGDIEDEKRNVKFTKPRAFTLSMPGFTEAAAFTEEIKSGDQILKTCSIEGLVMLKLISWDDRPHRTKDLTDIDNIVDAYFDWNSDEIYSAHFHVMEIYDTNDLYFYLPKISAHIIGMKMKPIVVNSPALFERVKGILKKRNNPRWEAMLAGLDAG